MADDQAWQQGIVEGPDMVEYLGRYYLFYSGGAYASAGYGIGYATCASPGPCQDQSARRPWLGPGDVRTGGPFFIDQDGNLVMAFAAWPYAVGDSTAASGPCSWPR